MSRSWRGKKAGEDAERLLQEAFGVSEDQLLKDFILAQTEVKDSDIPPESEDGFERLMAKLEAEVGTSPESEKESSSENIVKLHEEASKPRRLKSIVKVSVAAAAIAVMVVAMGISAGAKREYRYVVREGDSVRSDIVLNNVKAISGEDELDKAYIEITKKTKVRPLKLAYMPKKMKYVKADIGETWVIMYFSYGKYRVKILEEVGGTGNSTNVISDRKKEEYIYNDLLKENIYFEKSELSDGKFEYSANIVKGDTYYQISGIIPKKEFKKIVENLFLYTLICAGMIIAASMMQVYAADTQYINGVSVEEADYSNACLLNENVSEGIARGIEPRGSIIDTALTRISNLGKGDIGILIQTVAHVECDKIKNIAVLQREEDGKWVEVSRYIYDASKEDFPTEDLSGMSNDFTVKNQKTGYYYRVVGVHYVEVNGKGQSFMTKTEGIKITEYGD